MEPKVQNKTENTNSENSANTSVRQGLAKKIKAWLTRRLEGELSEEIHTMLEQRERGGAEESLSEDEKELIASALKFREVSADDISVPRRDIVCAHTEDSFDNIMDAFKESGFSRLPVCTEGLDDVSGFITLKDMLKFTESKKSFNLKEILRPCTFVPESLPIPSVLTLMRQNRVQMVMTVDEYGGTSGLISLKDILGELVGDLEDEHTEVNPEMLTPLSGGRYQIDAQLPIDELDASFKEKLMVTEDDEYDTVGGYLLHVAGRIPHRGEKFVLENGNKLLVLDADGRRINRIAFIPEHKKNIVEDVQKVG